MNRRAFIVALRAVYGCGQKEEPKKATEAPRYVDAALKGSKFGELPIERRSHSERAAE
jgi:hypothetical protein